MITHGRPRGYIIDRKPRHRHGGRTETRVRTLNDMISLYVVCNNLVTRMLQSLLDRLLISDRLVHHAVKSRPGHVRSDQAKISNPS